MWKIGLWPLNASVVFGTPCIYKDNSLKPTVYRATMSAWLRQRWRSATKKFFLTRFKMPGTSSTRWAQLRFERPSSVHKLGWANSLLTMFWLCSPHTCLRINSWKSLKSELWKNTYNIKPRPELTLSSTRPMTSREWSLRSTGGWPWDWGPEQWSCKIVFNKIKWITTQLDMNVTSFGL